ncbi:MAG: transcriptional repressor LexA [Methylocystaceae bacterium]
MAERLNERLQSIFDFIRQEVSRKGYPPSVREIGEAVGLRSTSTVHSHLNRLEELGYIRRDPSKTRAIELVEPLHSMAEDSIPVPLVGRVAAGVPITAIENLEGNFPVPARYIRSGNYFLLEVKGESMIEAGMFEQDLILVRQQDDAQNGDIVVAMVDNEETTVKRFYRRDHEIELVPENSAMSPFHYPYGQVKILGKVVALFRELH